MHTDRHTVASFGFGSLGNLCDDGDPFVDRSKRRWTRGEMLALGRKRFARQFDRHYPFTLTLFAVVARDAARQEARRLSPTDRVAFRALDREWERLADAALALIYELDYMGGGSALLGEVMELAADREEALRRCALFWNVPVAGAWRRWAATRRTLDTVLDPRRALPNRERAIIAPLRPEVFHHERRNLLAAFGDLEELRLSGYVRAACADHVRAMAIRIDRRPEILD